MDEVVSEDLTKTGSEDKPHPLPTEEGWTEYILSLMDENDIFLTDNGKKYPTVAGLRKVLTKFYTIISSTSRVASVYTLPGDPYPTSTVEHTIVVVPNDGGAHTTWSGCGTVGPFNQQNNDLPYPTECAETKAKGRAYTNLLGLNVCTKDEITTKPLTVKSSDKISIAQIKKLQTFCKTVDVDVGKLIKSGRGYSKVEDVSAKDYHEMFDYLNKLQQGMHNKNLSPKDEAFLQSIKA